MVQISQDEIHNLHNLIDQNPQEALKLLSLYEQRYVDDINFHRYHGAALIDLGSRLQDSALIERGMESIQQLILFIEEQSRPLFLYNLGNGYSALYSILRGQPNFSYSPENTPLTGAKACYRAALQDSQYLDKNLQAQLLVNYGNCLAHLGRSIEAISEYNAALDYVPDHPMALGNLGMELEHFAFVARHSTLLQDAHEALCKALMNDQLEQLGESWARMPFERSRQHIEKLLSRMGEESRGAEHITPTFSTTYQRSYVEFCNEYQLFLNFYIKNVSCKLSIEDSISFSLTTALNDDSTFTRLSRIVNEVKERYALARLLMYEACNPPYETLPYDKMTYYSDNLDYAVYGVRTAKLKVAYESAYNILDKIAFFINDYLGLGIRQDKINFHSIWREPRSTHLRPKIKDCNNHHLYALFDISSDLELDSYFGHLKKIRNYLTHRYLVPHIEKIEWATSADSPEYHLGYRELMENTIQLMRLVRNAVIYLIAFLDQEERKKRRVSSGFIAPMIIPHYRPYSGSPQDAPI